MKSLSAKQQAWINLTLFLMFFGAGNLIFPSYLTLQAGSNALPAFAGFALSAVGLPILGVVAVARSGGLAVLAGRVGKAFTAVFTLLIYLSIGPCLAIPRTAGTSFEMAVTPFLGQGAPVLPLRVGYSIVFFGVALLLALYPNRLVEFLGKRLAPVLLALIALLFVGCLVKGGAAVGAPAPAYATTAAAQGFLDGYQTMDAIAALIFGLVLGVNIRACGAVQEKEVMRSTVRAGWLAGALFLMVYGALAYLGAVSGAAGASNGAEVLSTLAGNIFGAAGRVILAGIFVIACLNTCVGLICCCATYFSQLWPRWSYRCWAVLFAAVSAVLANAGLDAILRFSVPVLNCLYPLAITLIALAFLPQSVQNRPLLYPFAAAAAGFFGAVFALEQAGVAVPVLTSLVAALPFYEQGLVWVLPALAAGLVGALLAKPRKIA